MGLLNLIAKIATLISTHKIHQNKGKPLDFLKKQDLREKLLVFWCSSRLLIYLTVYNPLCES
ncbi:hypothetical protein M595_5295 [Lyngbya aestuarii BL J]|uniref:Uncharacterized protein n=1 Tax=Lyngbya aestuarii BL J TaxID=1348334 RepID=U7QCL9_9CYAN|nr:hypothetical protein M595_5295 [Lyngbya aestuarii BL J]